MRCSEAHNLCGYFSINFKESSAKIDWNWCCIQLVLYFMSIKAGKLIPYRLRVAMELDNFDVVFVDMAWLYAQCSMGRTHVSNVIVLHMYDRAYSAWKQSENLSFHTRSRQNSSNNNKATTKSSLGAKLLIYKLNRVYAFEIMCVVHSMMSFSIGHLYGR